MTDLASLGLCYLATPYTKYAGGLDAAYKQAAYIAAKLLKRGCKIYSPIAHCHPLAIHGGLNPLDHSVWIPFDEAMMTAAQTLIVARMAGWESSYGVKHEINFFTAAGKPVFHLDPVEMQMLGQVGR